MRAKKQRVAAYGVCINDDDEILLARWLGPNGKRWILPGGGIDHGEHPHDAVIREFEEETGFQVEVLRLIGIDSELREEPRWSGKERSRRVSAISSRQGGRSPGHSSAMLSPA